MPSGERGRQQRENANGLFASLLRTVREKIFVQTGLEYSLSVAPTLLALASLLNYCPRCGEWQGSGSEGAGAAAPPSRQLPPPPPRLIRAISASIQAEPVNPNVNRDASNLTPNSGILEAPGERHDSPAKLRHQPPSVAHGRRIDAYYDGSPNPDSRPHAHESDFVRGDGEVVPIYERARDGEVVFDSGVAVAFQEETGAYVWTPKPQA